MVGRSTIGYSPSKALYKEAAGTHRGSFLCKYYVVWMSGGLSHHGWDRGCKVL